MFDDPLPPATPPAIPTPAAPESALDSILPTWGASPMSDLVFWLVIALAAIFFIGVVFAKVYKRTTKEEAFVRTGLGGEKVIMDGGAIRLPFLHDLVKVNMRTLRLQVDRKNEEGLITADRMRVDVTAEFYVRVKPEKESIAKAAQTLGDRTVQPELLKELLQGKFVDSLRSVAAGLSMEQLHEQRAEFVQSVQSSLSEDLIKNGLELESVSLTALDQTAREFFKEDNAFDAQGLAKLTLITEKKREERNRIEQDTRIQIELKNLEAEKQSLDIRRDEEMAKVNQRRAVEVAVAEQEMTIAIQKAQRKREAEETRVIEEQKEQEAGISADQAIRERNIEANRRVEEADIERQQAIDIAQQVAAIAVAQKSQEQSQAEAEAAMARAARVREEEGVETVRETAVAERQKQIRLIKAREDAEEEAISVTVAAEAEKRAAEDRASARVTEARAEAERVRIIAEADQRRLEVEAYGEQVLNEAKNMLSQEMIDFELRKLIAEAAPRLVEAMVKPAERIESIKVIQTGGGLGSGAPAAGGHPGADAGSASAPAGVGLPQQLTEALLHYRMQSPLVDQMLAEIGIDPNSLSGLTAPLSTGLGAARTPPAGAKPGGASVPSPSKPPPES